MRLDRCRDDIRAELELIAREVARHEPLLRKVRLTPPDEIEIEGAAVLLHAFYNGVENIFKSIANHIDEARLTSTGWHRELLNLMARAVPRRPAVLSPELYETLESYLGFRHIFRHAYSFEFNWSKMKDLVEKVEETHRRFRDEINAFLTELERRTK